ncbi:MAG: DoxX family protein [Saprospiraceae bacterium]
MQLTTLIIYFAISGAALSVLIYYLRWHRQIAMTFFQCFCGVWFIFSGLVKAIDPIGTAYKLEQYFAEFEGTFSGANWKNLAAMFPLMTKYSIGISVFTIVLEILLGVMLLVGIRNRLTAWLFFGLMLFFTALTEFTFLTGYVPSGINFFEFSKWGPYVKTNMRVTDCGCFGDFILLEPKISFYKDLFLMLPALFFIIRPSWMHRLFTRKFRFTTGMLTTAAVLIFCFSNFYWDLPVVDFRPFKIGTNLPDRKKMEEEATAKVKIIAVVMENEKTGEKKKLNIPEGMDYAKFYVDVIFKEYTKEAGWKVQDLIKTEPEVPHTKVSEFQVYDTTESESDVSESLLNNPEYSFIIIAYKLLHDKVTEKSIMRYDTLHIVDTIRNGKNIAMVSKDSVLEKEIPFVEVEWDRDYLEIYKSKINPFAEAAQKNGNKVCVITHDQPIVIRQFSKTVAAQYPIYQADDILLKTIIRSNPGVLLMKGGTVVNMWHIKKLPSFEEVKASF